MPGSAAALPMIVRADHVPGPKQGFWTYDDYATIPEDGNRYEIVDGVLYMTPAPGEAHQAADGNFTTYLKIHVQFAGLGRVYPAPFDVELAPGVTVQPDVVVVLNARLGIITEKKIVGTPDLVVEIASPGTVGYDRRTKQDAYACAGVPEYWFADPRARTVEVLCLADGSYQSAGVFEADATLPSQVLPGFPVRVEQFFA